MTDDTTPTDDGTDEKSRLGSGRRTFLGASTLVGAGALGAVGSTAADDHDGNESEGDEMAEEAMAMVAFEDQTTDGSWVTVAEAMLPEGGFVTIHDSSLLDGEILGKRHRRERRPRVGRDDRRRGAAIRRHPGHRV